MQAEILTERWIWLIGSICIAIVASWIKWGFRRTDGISPGEQGLRLIYAVGIPAVALLWRGALTSRGLGLQAPPWHIPSMSNPHHLADWTSDIGWAIFIMGMSWTIVTISERGMRYAGNTTSYHRNLGIALREAVYHQVHWAFYREPFVLAWSMNIGTWAGLLPVVIEAVANPEHWTHAKSLPPWKLKQRYRHLLIRATLAVVSAMMYLKTQNLWLAILVDTGLGWIFGQHELNANSTKSKQKPKQLAKPA